MKTKTILLVSICLFAVSIHFFGEDSITPNEKESFYENNMLRINSDFWAGINITKGTIKYSISLSTDLERLLEVNSSAIASFHIFKSNRTMSMVFMITSLGCLAGDFGYLVYSMNDQSNFNPTITTGLAIGAIVSAVIGSIFDQLGYTNLFDSIWEYNKSLMVGR